MLQMLALSVSLSMDALGIGVSYAGKRITLTWGSRIIIGIISALAMFLSIQLGLLFDQLFPPEVMKIVGISILFLIGAGFIRGSLDTHEQSSYDFDDSSSIDWYEAVLLGVALSADSISTGIAVSVLGLSSIWVPILVGVMQVLFLWLGQKVVCKSCILCKCNPKVCGIFSGILLFVVALLRIVF